MNKNGLIFGLVLLLSAALFTACGTAPAVAPVEAQQPAGSNTDAPAAPAAAAPTETLDTAYPAPAASAPDTQAADPYPAPAAGASGEAGFTGQVVYHISQEDTLAGFAVNEVLRGNPFTAQGSTHQVTGDITVDYDAVTVQVGPIQVAANTLRTDSTMRDRAIGQFILQTGNYPTITFTPKAINGLPAAAVAGQEVTLQITGDLTIRDVTKEVTFETKVKLVSPERLEGSATATVLRSDFSLEIPSVPQVASVEDNVVVMIEFVAVK